MKKVIVMMIFLLGFCATAEAQLQDAKIAAALNLSRRAIKTMEVHEKVHPSTPGLTPCMLAVQAAQRSCNGPGCNFTAVGPACQLAAKKVPNLAPALYRLKRRVGDLEKTVIDIGHLSIKNSGRIDVNSEAIKKLKSRDCESLPPESMKQCFASLEKRQKSLNNDDGGQVSGEQMVEALRIKRGLPASNTVYKRTVTHADGSHTTVRRGPQSMSNLALLAQIATADSGGSAFNVGEFALLTAGGGFVGCGLGGVIAPQNLDKDGFDESGCGYGALIGAGSMAIVDVFLQNSRLSSRVAFAPTVGGFAFGWHGSF
ncbi:MAG: hypothetical protein HOE80_02805 [Candidatus Magasanikbacteria bacterium]|nr:hypothetical protein [Candidatus Magasanikbacteria bacterium]MBT4071628.1 hypothetical protein [Candidatus Magasanikbacteria bacterium]